MLFRSQISEMPAVIKVMESGGQYQVVIGTHAKDVYEALAPVSYTHLPGL